MSRAIPNNVKLVRGEPETLDRLTAAIGGAPQRLADVNLGHVVVQHRSSWVRSLEVGTTSIFIKTYRYQGAIGTLRAWRRTAPWASTRAAREFDALTWLRSHALPTARPLLALEARRCGFATLAVLVSERWPGTDLSTLLPGLDGAERVALATALADTVRRMHEQGFRDGNLDLRNLLASRSADGTWSLAKIDSPRYRLVPAGRRNDRWRAHDLARLLPQLRRFGLAEAFSRALG